MAYPMYGGYMQQQSNPYAQFSALQEQINRVQPTQPVQTTQPTSNVSWVFVSSEQQARDYAVVPSNTMWFMNSENSEIYAKACDQMGMTNFKAFTIAEKQQKKEESIPAYTGTPNIAIKTGTVSNNVIQDNTCGLQGTPNNLYADQLLKNCSGVVKSRQILSVRYATDTKLWLLNTCRILPKSASNYAAPTAEENVK